MEAVEASGTDTNGDLSASNSRFPVEVWERVIDFIAMTLGPDYVNIKRDPNWSTLRSCALVCRDWYYLTLYHLFQDIQLRGRKQLVALYKTLQERPHFRKGVRHVAISGASLAERRPVQHLGTFAAMFAGKLPNASIFAIKYALWTVGSVPIKGIRCLAAYPSVHTLYIDNVTLSSVAQLAHLVSVLPGLRRLWCKKVDCLQDKPVSPATFPLNCSRLESLSVRWVAPAVEDMFVRIGEACRVRDLTIAVDDESRQSSGASRSQTLLDTSAASLQWIQVFINVAPSLNKDLVDAVIGQHYNLSRHINLQLLRMDLWPDHHGATCVSSMLARVTSTRLRGLCVAFWPRDARDEEGDGVLTGLEEGDVLTRLDNILQETRFSAVVPCGICLCIVDHITAPNEHESQTHSTRKEWQDRWEDVVRRKMPKSDRRGILTTRHDWQGLWDWDWSIPRGSSTATVQGTAQGDTDRGSG